MLRQDGDVENVQRIHVAVKIHAPNGDVAEANDVVTGCGIFLRVMLFLGRELCPDENIFLLLRPRHVGKLGLARAAVNRNQELFVRSLDGPQSDFPIALHGCFLRKRWKTASKVVLGSWPAIGVIKKSKLLS